MTLVALFSVVGMLACHGKGGGDTSSAGDDTAAVHDADGDGYDSTAFGGDDCDDGDPWVHPHADDTWYDGVDSDCAGNDDYDADQDGSASSDYGGQDCDDSSPRIRPGELDGCGDGIDQDCDGVVDGPDCGVGTDSAAGLWHQHDRQFLGWAIETDCDLDGDGVQEVLVSAPGDDDEGVGGQVLGMAQGATLGPKDALQVLRSAGSVGFGSSIDCHGDLDGDGYADLMVSAFDDGVDGMGRAVTLLGPIDGSTYTDSDADVVWSGDDSDRPYIYPIGHRVQVADVTGDAAADLVASLSDYWTPWGSDARDTIESGSALVYRGPFVSDTMVGYDDWVALHGERFGEFDIGDLDGDGINDVLRNADETDDRPDQCGFIYSGADIGAAPTGTALDQDSAETALQCPGRLDHIGTWEVVADTDLDGDGYLDPFLALDRGWAAFQGRTAWSGLTTADARLEADFCGDGNGVRDADFSRDSDGRLLWAVSLQGYPDCTAQEAGFEGRVAVFRDWTWTDLVFDDAWRWIAWDPDSEGLDPWYMATRPVAFSHEDGTRLWFGDPAWNSREDGQEVFGRLAVFQMDDW